MKILKHSIRVRFTLVFIGVVAFLILLQCVINAKFLQRYYMDEKINVLKQEYSSMDSMVHEIAEEGKTLTEVVADAFGQNLMDSPAVAKIRSLNDASNINFVMIDRDGNTIVTTSREGEWMIKKLRFYLQNSEAIRNGAFPEFGMPADSALTEEDVAGSSTENKNTGTDAGQTAETENNNSLPQGPRTIYEDENYCIQLSFDFRSETSYLESWGYFSDGETKFLMSMPVAMIRDSVALTIQFTLMVGAFMLVFGGILVYFAAGAVTKPINRLAQLAKRMTELDFSARYEGNAKDEIGVLGDSMNSMSDRLERIIAELKNTNNKLQQDIREKMEIDDMRKDFIANVSHELKTPIALIEGYAEGLTEGMAEDPESRDYYCGVIMDEAMKMNKMVKQLTSLNDLEFGKDHTELNRFDAAELIRSIAETQKLAVQEKGAAVELKLPEHAFVWADEFKIEEVLTNYFTNALNHIDGEKRIIIEAKLEKEADLPAGDAVRGNQKDPDGEVLFVSVYNDGEQIPAEDLSLVWEKFFKVDKARTRAYGGSGIGLSIVKAIMASHGQHCGVLNQEKGVMFWFSLDASAETPVMKNA